MSEEQFKRLMNEAIPKYMESIFNGGNPLEEIMSEAMKENEIEE